MKTVNAQHEAVLGVRENVARAFSKKWNCMKRQEAAAIWKQRKSRTGKKNETSLQELQDDLN
jgi:hypothetical protein